MLLMNSRRILAITYWVLAFAALGSIVGIYRFWLHVNTTTVALTLLLFILLLASRWTLRGVLTLSVAATLCYNFYFLPPVGTLTISDPENWLALFVFLATAVIGARLSQRARLEAHQARASQRQLAILFTVSRELLQTDDVAALVNALPELLLKATLADSVIVYLLEGDKLYQGGLAKSLGVELPHFRQLALTLSVPETSPDLETRIPLRVGARPRGLLILRGIRLSPETFEAIGGLASIALDRAQALEDVARNEAGKESERLRTMIMDSITHELRTPIASIKAAASTLLAESEHGPGLASERRHELLVDVDHESDRLNRLVAQTVEMARIEAQEIHMDFASVTVAALIEHAKQNCLPVFSTHPVSVNLPELPPVRADTDLIGKVLCNLLENAAAYSRPGSPIFISAVREGDRVLTSVADRGIGIDPMEQELIFDRLFRSRSQGGVTPGAGMGLAISRALVEAHGGTLTVTSQPGHGSVFTFSLPVTA